MLRISGLSDPSASYLLADPALELADARGVIIARNEDWADSAQAPLLPYTATSVGAFSLPDPSSDAVMIATLPPGAYTAKVVNLFQADGLALLEVYAAP